MHYNVPDSIEKNNVFVLNPRIMKRIFFLISDLKITFLSVPKDFAFISNYVQFWALFHIQKEIFLGNLSIRICNKIEIAFR